MNGRLLVGTFLVVAACSTARIDVDIYKGPLTNEEDVQMHQLAAFAIGAKPVLVHLRDQMEAGKRRVDLWIWRNTPGYRSTAMPTLGEFRERTFRSREAEYVNSVLELYLDIEDLTQRTSPNPVRDALERYRDAYRIVNAIDEQGDADRRAWNALVARNKQLQEPTKDSLAARVKAFLWIAPKERRDEKSLVEALLADTKVSARTKEKVRLYLPHSEAKSLELPAPNEKNAEERGLGAFSRFRLLSERSLWESLAQDLAPGEHPDDLSARYVFAERGAHIAIAFLVACAELREAFELALERVIAHGEQTDASRAANRSLLVSAGHLVNLKRMMTVLNTHASGPEEEKVLSILKERTEKQVASPLKQALVPVLVDEARRAFGSDRRLAEAWLHLYRKSLVPRDVSPTASPWEHVSAQWKVFQGFLAGPQTDAGELAESSPDLALASLGSESLGFSTGRMPTGLDKLIERFYEAFEKHLEAMPATRKVLLAGLVEFAEKLRPVPVLAQLANVSVEGSFVTLTESIANSISTQADALERAYDWIGDPEHTRRDERDLQRVELEHDAWQGVLTTSRPSSSPLQSRPSSRLLARPTDVIDALIARLEYLRIDVAAQGGANGQHLKDLQAALDLAHAHRTGMARLLPAASYLRNSYPSSSLQGLPLLYETSILGDRGTPILEYGKKELAVIMDKQYWQTVNSIAVSGVGDTNSVLVKDDLGNWTVKSYSGDPKDIVAAMKQLALYATGAGISPAALVQAEQLGKVISKSRAGTALEAADKDLLADSRTSSGGEGRALLDAQWKQANGRARAALEAARGELTKALTDAFAAQAHGLPKSPKDLDKALEAVLPKPGFDALGEKRGLAAWNVLRKAHADWLSECAKAGAPLAARVHADLGAPSTPTVADLEKGLAAAIAEAATKLRKARLQLVTETRRALEVFDEATAVTR